MILSHFSNGSFKFSSNYKYDLNRAVKPDGLWLSHEDEYGWGEWCRDNSFRIEDLGIEHKFKCDTSKWLHIKNGQDLLDFTLEYEKDLIQGLSQGFLKDIDWGKVKNKYAGIVITPYQWELRLNSKFFWYYGWDCASACVWDLSTLVPHEQ